MDEQKAEMKVDLRAHPLVAWLADSMVAELAGKKATMLVEYLAVLKGRQWAEHLADQ